MQAFKAEFYVFDSGEVTMDDTLRVLLVDDEESYLETAAKISSAKALKPRCAPSGAMS